jgi:hypothetical protein
MGNSPQGEKMQRKYSVVSLATEVAEIWGELSVNHIHKSIASKETHCQELHEREAVRCAVEAAHHALRAQMYAERGL